MELKGAKLSRTHGRSFLTGRAFHFHFHWRLPCLAWLISDGHGLVMLLAELAMMGVGRHSAIRYLLNAPPFSAPVLSPFTCRLSVAEPMHATGDSPLSASST